MSSSSSSSSSVQPSTNPHEVLKSMNLIRYSHYVPKETDNHKQGLKRTNECIETAFQHITVTSSISNSASSLDGKKKEEEEEEEENDNEVDINTLPPLEQLKRDPNRRMLAIISASKKESAERDRFFRTSNSFLIVRNEEELLKLHHRLLPQHRNMCTVAMEYLPCHLFFDVDGKTKSSKDPKPVLEAIRRLVEVTFLNEWPDVPMDVSGELAFEACSETKFSMHYHVTSEPFRSIHDVKAFVAHRMIPRLYIMADQGHPDALVLGSWNEAHTEYTPFIDQMVYTRQRVFRFPGHRKPDAIPLRFLHGPKEVEDSEDQQILRTQLSYYFSKGTDRMRNMGVGVDQGFVPPPIKTHKAGEEVTYLTYEQLRGQQASINPYRSTTTATTAAAIKTGHKTQHENEEQLIHDAVITTRRVEDQISEALVQSKAHVYLVDSHHQPMLKVKDSSTSGKKIKQEVEKQQQQQQQQQLTTP